MSIKTGIIASSRFFEHCIDLPVKEKPSRLYQIYADLKQSKYQDLLISYPLDSLDDEIMARLFSELYLDQLRNYSIDDNPFSYDKDTYLMDCTIPVARLAAGSCLKLVDGIMGQEITQGFAIIRPPGHHADQGNGMGFCVFNNVAIAANHLLEHHGLERVLIFDFDAHHGNGTQNWFYNDQRVLTMSIHQEKLFPQSTGFAEEFGDGMGLGYNINIPVKACFGDLEYNCLFGKVAREIIEQFMPQFILVAAGFDGHQNDGMSDLALTTDWYRSITGILKYLAAEFCSDRLMYILEGGYQPDILNETIIASLDAMIAPPPASISFSHAPRAVQLIKTTLQPVFKQKWTISL